MIHLANISPGTFVLIHKVAASASPFFAAGSLKGWAFGDTNNRYSLPVDYVMRGVLMSRMRVGGQIDLYRTHRNGVSVVGHFQSTPIVAISPGGFVETFNSIYAVSLDQAEDCL
jgi:hypothetical protein